MTLPVLDCLACGACCSDVGLPPFRTDELRGVPEDIRLSHAQQVSNIEKYPRGTTCSRFDLKTKQCTIYLHRPAICRDLEVGGTLCQHYRRKAGVA